MTHLLNEMKKSSVYGGNLTRDACTNVIFSVIMMDEFLRGVKGKHKYQKIRLPFELFEDFRIGGSLHCVLRGTLETMVSHSISVLNNSVPLEKLQAILDRIWEHVAEKGLWQPTRILFDLAMAEPRRAELNKLAMELGAIVVKDRSENPTHIVVDQEIAKPKSFIVRDIDIDTKIARLHWVGTPSSYDDWVPKVRQGLDVVVTWKEHCAHYVRGFWPTDGLYGYRASSWNEWKGDHSVYRVASAVAQVQRMVASV